MSQMTFDGFVEASPQPEASSRTLVSGERGAWYTGRVLSHSSIAAYRACPQKWKFKYIDKIPEKPRSFFSFGKSVHAGLEFLFSRLSDSPPALDEVMAHYKAGWLSDGYESPVQEKWFFQEGERILKGFFAKHAADFARVVSVEQRFTVHIDGVPITGFIDRIDSTPNGGLAIVDYKTGKAFDKARVRTDPQLTLYQLAVREVYGKPVETVTLYHLNSLTPLTVPAHSSAMESNVRTNVVEAARGIIEGRFDPKPDERGQCQWCDYQQVCSAFAGRKLGPIATSASLADAKEMTDRLGKIEQRMVEMAAERERTAADLAAKLTMLGLTKVEGRHFDAEVTDTASLITVRSRELPS